MAGKSTACRVVAALVLANLPFWLLSTQLILSRAVFNLDLILALAVLTVHRGWGWFLLAVAWFFDGAVAQSLTYHFASPLEFLQAGRFATELTWRAFLNWPTVVVAFLFFVSASGCDALMRRQSAARWHCLGWLLMLGLADVTNGSSMIGSQDLRMYNGNLAGSPSANVAFALAQGSPEEQPLQELPPKQGLTGLIDIPRWARDYPRHGIVLVIVESLGAPVAPALQAWLDSRLSVPTYDTKRVLQPFKGSTTYGELRVLCDLAGHYSRLTREQGRRCLPSVLSKAGWNSAGFHGFSRNMFNRQLWWPYLGLHESHFADSPLMAGLPRCGAAFVGICDRDVLRRAFAFASTGRRMAYVLSLHTHLPLGPVSVPPDLQASCTASATPEAACKLIAALGQVLADIAAQADAAHPSPLVVVAGDHAPPFSSKVNHDRFRQGLVPTYLLLPRDR